MEGNRASHRSLLIAKQYSHYKLKIYDQERLGRVAIINQIIMKPASFMHQRKCQKESEWLQCFFSAQQSHPEFQQLAEYYKYYHNTPTLIPCALRDIMIHYWNKTKALYYRNIKKQLQMSCQQESLSTQRIIDQTVGLSKTDCRPFRMPSQFLQQLQDTDNTLRDLLDTMTPKQGKTETRDGSIVGQFKQKTNKKQLNNRHLKTNPSILASSSSLKKIKKKIQHKSLSNPPPKEHSKPKNKQKNNAKQNPKHPQTALNYQRRNHPTNKQKKSVPKHRQESTGKTKMRNSQKRSVLRGCESSTKIKAAIDRTKNKIKAEKQQILKQYSEHTPVKSMDNRVHSSKKAGK